MELLRCVSVARLSTASVTALLLSFWNAAEISLCWFDTYPMLNALFLGTQRATSIVFCFTLIPCIQAFYGLQGHTYIYNWTAALHVGIPELSDVASSSLFMASIQITVQSKDSKRLLFEVRNFSTTNMKAGGYPWATPVISQLPRLSKTVITEEISFSFFVSLQDTETRLLFPPTDEGFAGTRNANLCRGIASFFMLQRPVEGLGLAEFTLQESTVSGTCATTYLVRPLKDMKGMESIDPSFCEKGILSEIVRTKNFDKCSIPHYYNSIIPPGFRCDTGSSACEGDFLRSSSTRSAVCSGENFTYPLHISNYNPFIVNPWGLRTEKVYSITKQNAILVGMEDNPSRDYSSRHSADIGESISFNFKAFSDSPQKENLEKFLDVISSGKDGSEIIDSVEELSKKLIYYDKQDFDRIMRRGRRNSKGIWRKSFFYALVSSGTEKTLTYLADLLEEGLLEMQEADYFISNLVMTIKTPYPKLLQRLVTLIDSSFVQSSSFLRKTALTSVSSLIRMSCVSPAHALIRFPVASYGPFCNSTNPVILHLAQIANRILDDGPTKTDRVAALSSLTTLGHESIIPIVTRFLRSKEAEDIELRTRGILAFHRLAHAEIPEVIRILYGVLSNYEESDQVRMGAFTLFILSNPPIHKWFQLAAMTWYEPDIGVASFIYTSFRAMSDLESPLSLLSELREKSRLALRIAKPVVDHRNVNQIWAYYLNPEKLGAYVRSELFSTKGEPMNLYTRLNWNIGSFDFDVAEVETSSPYIASVKDLWPNLFGGRKGKNEIYVHATFMESIERAYSATFQEIGNALQGSHRYSQLVSYQPLIRIVMEFPNDLGILTQYQVSVDFSAFSPTLSLDFRRGEEKLKGSFEGKIRIQGRASSTIGFLYGEEKLSTRSLMKASVDIDASGDVSFDISQQEKATLKFDKLQGKIGFSQVTDRIEGRNTSPIYSRRSAQVEESSLSFLGFHSRIKSSGYRLSEIFQELPSQTFFSALNFVFLLPPSLEERAVYVSYELRKTLQLSIVRDSQKNFTQLEMISDLKAAGGFDHREKGGHNKEQILVTFSDCPKSQPTTCRRKVEASNQDRMVTSFNLSAEDKLTEGLQNPRFVHDSTSSVAVLHLDQSDKSETPQCTAAIINELVLTPTMLTAGETKQKKSGLIVQLWNSPQMGMCMAIASSFSFSICSIVVKKMKTMHPIALATYRFLGLFLLSLPLLLFYKQNMFPKGKRVTLVLRSILGCLSLMSQFYAIKQMPLGDATVITFSVPVFVAIFARIFLKEKFTWMNALTIILTLAGCVLIARPPWIFGDDTSLDENVTSNVSRIHRYVDVFEDETVCLYQKQNFTKNLSRQLSNEENEGNYPNEFWGAIIAFAGTIFAANVYVVVRKLKGLHHSTIMTSFGFFAFLQTFTITAALDINNLAFDPHDSYWIFILAVFSFLGQVLLTMALQREQAGPVSVARSMTIIWAFLWQVFIFNEQPVILTLVGAGLVLISVLILAIRKWVESKPEDAKVRKRFKFLLL